MESTGGAGGGDAGPVLAGWLGVAGGESFCTCVPFLSAIIKREREITPANLCHHFFFLLRLKILFDGAATSGPQLLSLKVRMK